MQAFLEAEITVPYWGQILTSLKFLPPLWVDYTYNKIDIHIKSISEVNIGKQHVNIKQKENPKQPQPIHSSCFYCTLWYFLFPVTGEKKKVYET